MHGHAAGDQVLITTAARLRSVVRASDTVARLGGDEFVILLDEPAAEPMLEHLIGRIRDAIMKPVILDEGSTVNVGASIGYAVTSEPAEDSEELLDRADRTMYKIKRSRASSPRPAGDAPHGRGLGLDDPQGLIGSVRPVASRT